MPYYYIIIDCKATPKDETSIGQKCKQKEWRILFLFDSKIAGRDPVNYNKYTSAWQAGVISDQPY
jgi:hypothetical protein